MKQGNRVLKEEKEDSGFVQRENSEMDLGGKDGLQFGHAELDT